MVSTSLLEVQGVLRYSKEIPQMIISANNVKIKVKNSFFIFQELNYFGLKTTPSGFIVIQETGSNDILVLTKRLEEKIALQGKPSLISTPKNLQKFTNFCYEGDQITWLNSDNGFVSFDLTNQEVKEYPEIYPEGTNKENLLLLQSIGDFENEKFLINFWNFESKKNVLSYVEKGDKPVNLNFSKISKELVSINQLELFKEKDICLLSGQTSSFFSKSTIFALLDFKKGQKTLSVHRCPDSLQGKNRCLRMIKEAPDNFIASFDHTLAVYGLDRGENNLILLRIFAIKSIGKQLLCLKLQEF